MLSAQATDARVNKATKALFAVADTPDKMAALGEEGLAERIKTIGLYRAKARHVIALSQALIERWGGRFRRTATRSRRCRASAARRRMSCSTPRSANRRVAVDTHVFRVANRLGIAPGKTPREVEDELMQVIPDRFLPHAHHWLILHGRYVCKARSRCAARACSTTSACTSRKRRLRDGIADGDATRIEGGTPDQDAPIQQNDLCNSSAKSADLGKRRGSPKAELRAGLARLLLRPTEQVRPERRWRLAVPETLRLRLEPAADHPGVGPRARHAAAPLGS